LCDIADCKGAKLFQRPDDTPASIKNRFKIFLKETMPLVNHYKKLGMLYRYDGNVPVKRSIFAAKKIIAQIVRKRSEIVKRAGMRKSRRIILKPKTKPPLRRK
jgi:hypothetical protein